MGIFIVALLPLCILASATSLILRFRRSGREVRQQIKWLALAVTLVGLVYLGNIVAALVFAPQTPDPGSIQPAWLWLMQQANLMCYALVPVAVGVAVLKHRLLDVDLVINRALVYGALTACVAGVYVLVAGYLGMLFRAGGDLAISLVAAGIVAVLFAPLRDKLQRSMDRLMQAGVLRRLIPEDPAAADDLAVELRTELWAAIADIRRLVHDLRPPALDDLGLVAALRRLAERCGANGLGVSVQTPEELPPLPAAVEVAVYRIAQEALNNVVRHARARTCLVRLAVVGEARLEVEDDGSGIRAGQAAGVGLLSMRERAAELGGRCVVEAIPAGGTRVVVALPLSKE